jgi:hypothetical protein
MIFKNRIAMADKLFFSFCRKKGIVGVYSFAFNLKIMP